VAAVYWINAASFWAVLIGLVLMRGPTQQAKELKKMSFSALIEGLHFVRKSRIIPAYGYYGGPTRARTRELPEII